MNRLATPAARDDSMWLPRSLPRRVAAVAVMIVSLILAWVLVQAILVDLPSLPLLVAIGVTAVVGRTGPALVASAASGVILAELGLPPEGNWPQGGQEVAALIAFALVSVTLAVAVPKAELGAASERRKAARNAFLAGATSTIEAASDPRDAMHRLAAYVVPELADWCVVHIIDADGLIEQLTVVHQDPAKLALAEQLQREQPLDPEAPIGVPNVLRTGTPEYYRDVMDAIARVPESGEARRAIEDLGLRSLIIVPLVARGRTLGAITLVVAEAGYLYEPEDVEFAEDLASHAASTLELLETNDRMRQTSGRTEVLQRLTSALSVAVTVEEVVEAVIDQGARELHAAAALVAFLSDDGQKLTVVGQHGFDERIIESWKAFPVNAELPLSEAVRERRCVWIADRRERDERYPALAGSPLRSAHSTVCVPMVAGTDVLGGLTVMLPTHASDTSSEVEAFFMAIAGQAAQAIRRALLYEAQRNTATVLQQSLLPDSLPDVPGLTFAARYWSAEPHTDVGGDFYEVITTADGAVALIGDVCGRGVEAAAVMGMARHAAWAAVDFDGSPAAVLRRVNDVLLQHVRDLRFVTMCAMRISVASNGTRATIAIGGHPQPILVSGGTAMPVGHMGTLLGVFEAIDVRERTIELAPSDVLVLFTDGIVERGGRHLPFEDDPELVEAVVRAAPDPSALADGIAHVVGGPTGLNDDGALLVIAAAGKPVQLRPSATPSGSTKESTESRPVSTNT